MKMQHADHDGKAIEVPADQAKNYESQGWAEVRTESKPASK